jgi:signal peptidase I
MTETTSPGEPQKNSQAATSSFAWYVMLALGCAIFIRVFIAAPYLVSGASMEPTFDNFDYLITDRLSYRFEGPERGDVIVFCLPGTGECSLTKRIADGEWMSPRTLIKRVIGLPGETVSVDAAGVHIRNAKYPNGFILDEPYVAKDNSGDPTNIELTLGPDEFFVLGDNRRVSSDSRVWGMLPRENIIGHVLLRLFPLQSIQLAPGDITFEG